MPAKLRCVAMAFGHKDTEFGRISRTMILAGRPLERTDSAVQSSGHLADRVLTTGETDDPLEPERRTDEAMLAVAGFKSIKTDKAR